MRFTGVTLAAAVMITAPAAGEVTSVTEAGFVSRNSVEVKATPGQVWETLVAPGRWWSDAHTYSGDAANMSIDARVGGCFCEKLPRGPVADTPAGGVEHMHVIYADAGKMLRLSGALGPLQSEAVNGTLTVTIQVSESGMTRILWEYAVGGYMRYKPADIAPVVDKVMAEQLGRLAANADAGQDAAIKRAKP